MGLFSTICSSKKNPKTGPGGDSKATKKRLNEGDKDKKEKEQTRKHDSKEKKHGDKKQKHQHQRHKSNNKNNPSPDKRRRTADSSAPRKMENKREAPKSTAISTKKADPPKDTREVPAVLRIKEPSPPEKLVTTQSKMTFREYLTGVRKEPTQAPIAATQTNGNSKTPAPPNVFMSEANSPVQQQQQTVTPVPSSVLSFPTAPPLEALPTFPSPAIDHQHNLKITVNKSETQKNHTNENEGKQSPKSTEKIDESFALTTVVSASTIAPKGSNDKTEKEKEYEKMRGFFQYVLKLEVSELEAQFDKIRGYVPKSFTRNLFNENPDKCRFADIICMDQTRVVLDTCAKGGFVHANWVQMSRENNNDRFIISQCPTANTVFDFWHMVWQEGVSTVVNIMTETEYNENAVAIGLVPPSGQCRHVADGYVVTFHKESVSHDHDYRLVVYGLVHENEYRQLLWIDFRDWPEGRIPKGTKALLEVLSLIKHQRKPLLAMSIAGAGRAGTFVALELAHGFLHFTGGNRKLNVNECVQRVRDGRLHAVQNALQYRFIHFMLAEHVIQVKKIRKSLSNDIIERYESLHKSFFQSAIEDHDLTPSNTYLP